MLSPLRVRTGDRCKWRSWVVTALGGALVTVSQRGWTGFESGSGMQDCTMMEESVVMTLAYQEVLTYSLASWQLRTFQGVEEVRLDKEYGSCPGALTAKAGSVESWDVEGRYVPRFQVLWISQRWACQAHVSGGQVRGALSPMAKIGTKYFVSVVFKLSIIVPLRNTNSV